MSRTCGCIMRMEFTNPTHERYPWAIEGTIKNLQKVNNFLIERELKGYLFGGCLDKKLPRKDIDIALETCLDPKSENRGYGTLGIDWWYLDENSSVFARNLNHILVMLDTRIQDYIQKESGLLLPKSCLEEDTNSLTRILYTQKQLKGGERK